MISCDSPRRLLVVMPTWIGDAVMTTPTLRLIRDRLPGAFIGALVRPGIDEVLAGADFFDEMHIDPRQGVMGPKRAAARVRARRYDTALLLTNSFSSALATRLAWIRRRIGYAFDGRGLLLTERLAPPSAPGVSPDAATASSSSGAARPVPACEHYLGLARHLLNDDSLKPGSLSLVATPQQRQAADKLLTRAGLDAEHPRAALLNPGANNDAKRWPMDRFASVARHLMDAHHLNVLVNGSPAEAELAQRLVDETNAQDKARPDSPAQTPKPTIHSLPALGVSLGSLKALVGRCALMVTNDTGPRHIAAAFGTPVVSLFGPTDHRWTTIPFDDERLILADPSLPEDLIADDHPQRCDISRISVERVRAAIDDLLSTRAGAVQNAARSSM